MEAAEVHLLALAGGCEGGAQTANEIFESGRRCRKTCLTPTPIQSCPRKQFASSSNYTVNNTRNNDDGGTLLEVTLSGNGFVVSHSEGGRLTGGIQFSGRRARTTDVGRGAPLGASGLRATGSTTNSVPGEPLILWVPTGSLQPGAC